jgi:ankyrin repeat protein
MRVVVVVKGGGDDFLDACANGDIERCRRLIQRRKQHHTHHDDGNLMQFLGNGLLKASQANQLHVCKLLIEDCGVDVNCVMAQRVLHDAAYNGRVRVCALLLNYGAHVHLLDNNGFAPLHHAAKRGYAKICELLIAAGADVNQLMEGCCIHGRMAIDLANASGRENVRDLLLAHGADLLLPSSDGFYWRCRRNRFHMPFAHSCL